jgi:hypothetical protein
MARHSVLYSLVGRKLTRSPVWNRVRQSQFIVRGYAVRIAISELADRWSICRPSSWDKFILSFDSTEIVVDAAILIWISKTASLPLP